MTDEGYGHLMTINEVVKIAGVTKRTLQYYDSIGLLPAQRRSDNGYRLYGRESLETLKTIACYKEMGFELKEIKKLLCSNEDDIVLALKNKKEQLIREASILKEKLEKLEEALKRFS